MKKIKYLLFSIFLFLMFSITNVFASSNYNTYVDINLPDFETYLSNFHFSDNVSLYDYFVDMFNTIDSETSNLITGYYVSSIVDIDNNKMFVRFLPKSYSDYSRSFTFYSGSTSSYYYRTYYGNTSFPSYNIPAFVISLNDYNITSSNFGLDSVLIDIAKNGGSCSTYSYFSCYSTTYYTEGPVSCYNSTAISDNSNYQCNPKQWFFYDNTGSVLSNYYTSYYQKSLRFSNGELVSLGYKILSYYDVNDILPTITDSYSLQFANSLDTIYSKIPIDNVNNFDINFSFFTDSTNAYDYLSNMSWGFNVFVNGRVNHNNEYFTFESLNCDFNDITNNYDNNSNQVYFKFSDIVCDSSVVLSNYDYIYFTMFTNYPNWNNNLSKSIRGINLTTSKGYINYRPFSGLIYEPFFELPSGFEIFFSTKGNSSYSSSISAYSSTNTTWYSAYDLTDLNKVNLDNGNIPQQTSIIDSFDEVKTLHLNSTYQLTSNYGYMIYNDSTNNNTSSTNLYTFLNDDTIMYSYKTNNNFSYYEPNTSTINSSQINIDYDSNYHYQEPQYNFDLSLSFNEINDFLSSIRGEIIDFSFMVNDMFVKLPLFLKTFIYILFNVMMMKIIIKLLKNDNSKGSE